MTKRKKAFERLLTKPNDFTWGELWSLMESLGYELRTVGGSKQKFVHPETSAMLFIHEPHPSKVLKV